MKRSLRWGLVGTAALAVGLGAYLYYRHTVRYPSTDDAYIVANVVRVGAQVTGQVLQVPVSNQQRVQRKQLLFQLDPRPFRYRLQGARAQLAMARQTVTAEQAAVEAARAQVQDRQAKLDNARVQYRRIKRLAARHLQSQAALDDARTAADSARADLALAQAQLDQAQKTLGTAGQQNQRIRLARAQLKNVQLDLEHTRVYASCNGQLSGLKLQPGDTVTANDPQFALVCSNRYWVEANYKETDLTRIRPGQVATVSVDMYPDHTFHGIVESVNPASGTAFSLLPPENATGNWVKVTQRVPVRILIVNATPGHPLRVQTSAEVSIDTGAHSRPKGLARGEVLSNDQAERIAKRQGLTGSTKSPSKQ